MSRFGDLLKRFGSAIVMIAIGLGSIWLGGAVFVLLIGAVVGLMIWELSRMLAPDQPQIAIALSAAAAIGLVVLQSLSLEFGLTLLGVIAAVILIQFRPNRSVFLIYITLILLAGYGLSVARLDYGLIWTLWLVSVVVTTDILGYFAGRGLGGAKLWSRISPNKTWSGTVAGWVGAAVVAMVFARSVETAIPLLAVSIALSMASQTGDIAESALKRRFGVKDSSSLIPGHGGFLDRFDGLLAASVALLLLGQIFDLRSLFGIMP